ncbi:MAG: GntG family PLP-dependent aldolase [Sphaerochaetaceae bacterium]
MKIYDLRSDTITKPTPQMRKAIAEAEVGDDIYREDPSVNYLESLAAEMLSKEASLFVPSGSMGNLIPLFVNGGRGSLVLASSLSHIIHHEVSALTSIAGILPILIDTPRGILNAESIVPHLSEGSYDMVRKAIIEVENTIGGVCYPLNNLKEIKALAEKNNMVVHMDGARLFNAAVATNVEASEIVKNSDTVTFCISKGLGAPVGSLLCGTKEFIEKARVVRKMLGSAMRQAGILAAGGIYALQNNINRLALDHDNAKEIALALSKTDWAKINLQDVETNILFFEVEGVALDKVIRLFKERGIMVLSDHSKIRVVTNLHIDSDDTLEICKIIGSIEKKDFLK